MVIGNKILKKKKKNPFYGIYSTSFWEIANFVKVVF